MSSPQGSWHSPHCHHRYIATTSQPEGILTIILLLQFFWNVLAAAGMPTWHVSAPIPLHCPGTITHANIAVSPNATLTAAIQTLEQPNRLHIISLKGNPTELGHTTGQQSVKCQQVGMIETPAGDALLECMFAPQSAGTSTMQFHCALCVPTLLSQAKLQKILTTSRWLSWLSSWMQTGFLTGFLTFHTQKVLTSFNNLFTIADKLDAERAPDVTCTSVQCMSFSILGQDRLHTTQQTVYHQLLCAMCRRCSTCPQPHITKQTGNELLSAASRQRGHV